MKTTLIMLGLASGLSMAPLLQAEPVVVETPGHVTVRTGVWTTVPDEYDGDYYTHEHHYYYGGKHELGDFEYEGRHYPERYEHEGKWLYGGKWEHHARKEK